MAADTGIGLPARTTGITAGETVTIADRSCMAHRMPVATTTMTATTAEANIELLLVTEPTAVTVTINIPMAVETGSTVTANPAGIAATTTEAAETSMAAPATAADTPVDRSAATTAATGRRLMTAPTGAEDRIVHPKAPVPAIATGRMAAVPKATAAVAMVRDETTQTAITVSDSFNVKVRRAQALRFFRLAPS